MSDKIDLPRVRTNPTPGDTSERVEDNAAQAVNYSNLVMVTVGPEEAHLHFGLRRTDAPQIADGVSKVYLSLANLKRLTASLNMIVTRYENAFGEIPDPSKVITPDSIKKFQSGEKQSNV